VRKKGYCGSSCVCPECGEDADFKGYASKTVTSLLGPIEYPRAYYHCDHCHHGWFPTDEELGLTERSTLGAREVIALAGVEDAFAVSAERVLQRLSGISVSASTVQRVTETVGDKLAAQRQHGDDITPGESWDWCLDAKGQRVAYVSLDATGVPQQGPHAERADGRMAWVASVFNPAPRDAPAKRRLRQVRYLSGLMSLDQIGKQLRHECQQVGVSRDDVVIGLTDGGNGLEDSQDQAKWACPELCVRQDLLKLSLVS